MENLPQEILREVGLLLDIHNIINLGHTSKAFNENKLWALLLREQAIELQPLLGSVQPGRLNWKTLALHAHHTANYVSRKFEMGPLQLERLLSVLRATRRLLDQQKARETIRGLLNNVPDMVVTSGYNEGKCLTYRAPVLYWICHCQPAQQEDKKFIAEIALDEVLKNTAAVNVPSLATPRQGDSIDWPINAAIMRLWTEGVKRLLQVENIALDVVSTMSTDYQRVRVSPLQCIVLAVTNRKFLKESQNLSLYDIQAEHEHRFVSQGVHKTIKLADKVIPARERGLEILKQLLTRVNPNQPNGAITSVGEDYLLAKAENIEERGFTALHMACYYQVFGTWVDGIKALIDAGANVNAQSAGLHLTPLHMLFANIQYLSTRFRHEYWSEELEVSQLRRVVELFLAHGADLSLSTTDGMNVLHYALVAHKHLPFDESIISLLQQHCPRAAAVPLPWSVCVRCKKRYDVSANNSTACAIHTEAYDECSPYNPEGSDTYPCCGGKEDSRGCSLAYHL